ncbi:hypothetical protein P60_gp01 [Synechococcus phage P60]|uniref:Uncharacterized protein n=1 Tax=Synechococcus phage P60 TaxID=2905923 RepID=Q8W6Y6_9CAUD|nr:hypothetical protein P60_gp01 [Synechococcus phage P60]AAL73293.1 hypothetical protein P60_gp01 [Synechococcus phage P60]
MKLTNSTWVLGAKPTKKQARELTWTGRHTKNFKQNMGAARKPEVLALQKGRRAA